VLNFLVDVKSKGNANTNIIKAACNFFTKDNVNEDFTKLFDLWQGILLGKQRGKKLLTLLRKF